MCRGYVDLLIAYYICRGFVDLLITYYICRGFVDLLITYYICRGFVDLLITYYICRGFVDLLISYYICRGFVDLLITYYICRGFMVLSLSRLFADDTSLGYSSQNVVEIENVINHDLCELNTWSTKWLMSFNPDKTEIMLFSNTDVRYILISHLMETISL